MTYINSTKPRNSFEGGRALKVLYYFLTVVFVLSTASYQIQAQAAVADARRLYLEGVKARETSTYDDALEKFEAALKVSPDYAEAHLAVGLIYVAKNRNDKAMSEFKEVLRLNSSPVLVKQANWAIKRLETPNDEKSQRRPIAAPNVKKLVGGWDKIIVAVRDMCDALRLVANSGDFETAEEKMRSANRRLNSAKYYPKWYVIQFETLLSSPDAAQRLAVLTAVGDLISEIDCDEEWKFLGRPTLGAKLRLLVNNEKNSNVREEALRTLEKWEEGNWWWNE